MQVFAIILALSTIASSPTVAPTRGTDRYTELRTFSVNRCYNKMLDASPDAAVPLLQLAMPLSEMCGCIGDMTATAFLPLAMPDLRKIDEPKLPAQQKIYEDLYKSIATICSQKLNSRSN